MPKALKRTLIALAVLIVVFCLGSYAFDRYMLGQTYARVTPDNPTVALTEEEIAAEYPSENVEFQMNGKTLRGHVYQAYGRAGGEARGLIIFRHGITASHEDYLPELMALADKGWKVFGYDAIGAGESDGDSVIGFAQSPLDVRAAVDFAYSSGMVGDLPVVLWGHSWGAYGVAGSLDFADVRDRVQACVAMSGFDTPDDIIMESATNAFGPIAGVQKPFFDLIGWMDFGADGARSSAKAVSNCTVPTLLIHGTNDETINVDGASIIAEQDNIANPNVQYITKEEDGRNGHNTYFYTAESFAYFKECKEHLKSLTDQAEKEAYVATVDKRRANTADPVLIDEIDTFFASATGR